MGKGNNRFRVQDTPSRLAFLTAHALKTKTMSLGLPLPGCDPGSLHFPPACSSWVGFLEQRQGQGRDELGGLGCDWWAPPQHKSQLISLGFKDSSLLLSPRAGPFQELSPWLLRGDLTKGLGEENLPSPAPSSSHAQRSFSPPRPVPTAPLLCVFVLGLTLPAMQTAGCVHPGLGTHSRSLFG